MNLNSDVGLLTRIKQGDSAAFDALFRKYYKMLCVNAFFYLKNEADAEDLVQTFFIEFVEKRIFEHLEGEIKGYLFKSIHNRCLNHIRKSNSLKAKQEEFEFVDEERNSDEYLMRENVYVLIERALYDLPLQRKQALTMVYLENRRYQEAADRMGISINSLKTHLKLGLKSLRKIMKASTFTHFFILIVVMLVL